MADIPPTDVLDPAALARLGKLQRLPGRNFIGELVGLFRRDVPPQVAACQDALARGDSEALRRCAHAVKGSSGVLGARELGELCAQIELEATSDAPGDLTELVRALGPALDRANAALDKLVAESEQ